MNKLIEDYLAASQKATREFDWSLVTQLAELLLLAVEKGNQLFICGNGGSAGNANHLANDFVYGVNPNGYALKAEALSANSAVLTCLGNDIGYDSIYSHLLKVKASANDILLVLSGSGNSPNIVNALQEAKAIGMTSAAILGYSGGKAKQLADIVLHFDINDMQIAEDMQLVVGHMLMRYLNQCLQGYHEK